MSWNETEARTRIRDAYKETEGLTLTDLTREMNLHELSLTDCRRVAGVHLYLDVTSFSDDLDAAKENSSKLQKLLRDAHLYQRLMRALLRDFEGSVRVHFQGMRLHAVFHKPYDTEQNADAERVRIAMEFVSQARELAALLSAEVDRVFELEAGMESGITIAARNGQKNARELMFVGDAANQAAKILTGVSGDRFGTEAEKLKSTATPAELPKKWKQLVKDEVAEHPVSSFETFEPEVALDIENLGHRTADLRPGISFFADIKGFTRHVADLKSDAEKIEALRVLHAVRGEMHAVAARGYDGDFVQYQGDRLQTIHYEAKGTRTYVSKVVEAAAAMRRAFELCRDELEFTLDVTMGGASGRTFVTRIGVKGDKELIALGRSVSRASELQDGVETGGTVAVNQALWELLDGDERGDFKKIGDDRYEATLSLKKLVAKAERSMFDGRVSVVGDQRSGRTVRPDPTGFQPAKSYFEK